MRQKSFLSPHLLREFKSYCDKNSLQIVYIDEYFYILSGMVPFEETRDFESRINLIAGKKNWETPADRQMFFRRYMDLVTSTGLLVESIEKGEKSATGKIVDELFECFRDIHATDPVQFSLITGDWGYRIARIITDTYGIMPGENIEDFTRNIVNQLGGAYGQILPGFISLLGQNLKEPKDETLKAIFRIITVMVSDMNIRRKAVIEEGLGAGSDAEVGRNEPCPCGSGLKYKKCCLNKIGSGQIGNAGM